MQKRIIEICDKLSEQGIKPTLEKVRTELGGGSFSTINPVLKQWKESRELNDSPATIDLPNEITVIGIKAAGMIWKAANDQCNDLVKAIRHETDQLTEQAHSERDEALGEIQRLEAENQRLTAKAIQQDELIGELRIKAALAEKSDVTINTLRAELEKAQKENSKLEGMLVVYQSIGGTSTTEPQAKSQATRKTKQQATKE